MIMTPGFPDWAVNLKVEGEYLMQVTAYDQWTSYRTSHQISECPVWTFHAQDDARRARYLVREGKTELIKELAPITDLIDRIMAAHAVKLTPRKVIATGCEIRMEKSDGGGRPVQNLDDEIKDIIRSIYRIFDEADGVIPVGASVALSPRDLRFAILSVPIAGSGDLAASRVFSRENKARILGKLALQLRRHGISLERKWYAPDHAEVADFRATQYLPVCKFPGIVCPDEPFTSEEAACAWARSQNERLIEANRILGDQGRYGDLLASQLRPEVRPGPDFESKRLCDSDRFNDLIRWMSEFETYRVAARDMLVAAGVSRNDPTLDRQAEALISEILDFVESEIQEEAD